ncbi:methyltransferase domain-containing protein [Colletotrichum asianum]
MAQLENTSPLQLLHNHIGKASFDHHGLQLFWVLLRNGSTSISSKYPPGFRFLKCGGWISYATKRRKSLTSSLTAEFMRRL